MAAVLEERHFPNSYNIHSLPDIKSSQRPLPCAVPWVLPRGRSGFSIGIVDGLAEGVIALKSKALLEHVLQRCGHAVVDRIGSGLDHIDRAEARVQAMEHAIRQQVAGKAVQVD